LAEDVFVAGIDVGTTKICTVVGRPQADGRLEVVGVGVTPSAGLKRGIIVDREDAIGTIRQSIDLAQGMAEVEIHSAYVGVTGAHIASANVTGRTNVSPGPAVSDTDVQRAIQSARDAVPLPQDREIIHEVVREFAVDGEGGIMRPIGMSGRRLDVELHAVTGTATIIENIEGSVEECGIKVGSRGLEPIATGTAVITQAERELGVILIDVGGGTTDVAVFVGGGIAHTSAIPVGGDNVTRDLARLLRCSFEEAEQLKCQHARARPEKVDEDQMIQVTLASGGETEAVPLHLVASIIEPRLEEIFALVKANVVRSGTFTDASAGVVLSGGGSQLPDTTDIVSAALDDLPVRVGSPRGLTGRVDLVSSPIHATGVGLAVMAAQDESWAGEPPEPENVGLVDRIMQWWDRLLPRV